MNYSTLFFQLFKRSAFYLIGSLILFLGLNQALMADTKINTGYFGNVAIKGYDPVAYFTEGKAMEGSEDHALKWLGANWHFASNEHKEMFAATPTAYAPQYGGHCATGIKDFQAKFAEVAQIGRISP